MAEYGEIVWEPRLLNVTNQEIRIEWVTELGNELSSLIGSEFCKLRNNLRNEIHTWISQPAR